ncbi:MAG: MgtC/SapB family protein [Gemmatimonadetes bacterium]|nr:MgtC/SapB family protein [Gemmatimonadota bacterium]
MDLGIDFDLIISHLVHLLVAYALAFPIAWDREARDRSAGLRTFPLVAIGSCAYMLVAGEVLTSPEAQARVMAGFITGIGFIGGGAILKNGGSVRGTATAASIWNTGALGTAVALDRIEIAIVLAVTNFLTLRYVPRLKSQAQSSTSADE